ncbi:MAG: hypothetical protein OQK73_10405, partial [Gammaproteobacteria bacterium]|nr:hypothetical protein [Gammaproteobacteria bacterium]
MNIQIFSSLRVRLMLLTLLGAIPLLILLIFSGLELREHAADDVQRGASHMVMMAGNEQLRLVEQTRHFLSVLAQVPQIQNDDIVSCNSYLRTLLKETGTYVNIGVINLQGDLICSGTPLKVPINVKERSYFQRTLKTHDFSMGEFQSGQISSLTIQTFSYPVFNESKQLKAILCASIPFNWLDKYTSETPLPSGSIINVIDRSTHSTLAQYPKLTIQTDLYTEQSKLIEATHGSSGIGTVELIDPDGVQRRHTFEL